MRLIVIILLVFALIYCLGIRPLLRQPMLKITASLLAVCLLPTAYFEIRWQLLENTGTTIVKLVSHNPNGHLTCERFSTALFDASPLAGEVAYSEPNEAYLHYKYCQDIQSWLASDKRQPTRAQIIALHVLVHEAVHVGGDFNEASTECKAMAAETAVFEKLGATPAIATAMHDAYVQQVYPSLGTSYHQVCA